MLMTATLQPGAALPTLHHFAKATFDAISKTNSYLTPISGRDCVHQVFLAGIHRTSYGNPYNCLCTDDPGSSCGYNIEIFIYKSKVN
jgi:hypothetical protein